MSHQGSSIDKQDNVTKRLTCLQEARVAGAAEEEEEEEGCGGTLVDLVMDLVVDLVATVVDLVATVVEGAEEVEEGVIGHGFNFHNDFGGGDMG